MPAASAAGPELVAFLRAALPADWVTAVERGDASAVEALATGAVADEAIRRTADAGWLTPDWPERYGGRGLDASAAGEVKALLRHWHVGDVRTAIGTAWVGPTILQWGDDAQRDRWLPPIAAATELWCQLFSEPEAGSDLAGMRTAATQRPDGTWLIEGSKVWTSRADISRRGLLVARCDRDVPKHRGLVAFGLDMTAPGVRIAPITQMTGDAEFFEVQLDGVELADADRLGPPGAGWDVCRTALSFERIAGSGVGAAPPGSVVGRSVDELVAHHAGHVDAGGRAAVVGEWTTATVIELLNRRVAARRAAGLPVGPEGSVTKVLQAAHTKRLQRLFVDLAGPAGVAWEPGDPWAERNAWAFLRVQAKTIAGGTSEVLRNQLAERILGLPRDEDPSVSIPWREAVRAADAAKGAGR